MLSTIECAERLGVSNQSIRNYIENGQLTAYRFGKDYRVKESDLEVFIENNKVNTKGEKEQ